MAKYQQGFPVNEDGEIVVSGTNQSVVGVLPIDMLPVDDSGGLKLGNVATLVTDEAGNLTGVATGGMNTSLALAEKNVYYHFHGAASLQCADDLKFYDIAGENHGNFGVNLSVANAWANAGYVSTIDPAGGSTDSVIRIPSLNYDYDGGEKLIVWWLGKCTSEGSDVTFMGDSYGTAVPGVRVRARSTGKIDVVCYGGGVGRFSPASTATVFDGSIRDFAFVIDGANRKYGVWVDGVFDAAFGGSLANMGAGSADTRTSNTWQIGAGSAAPGGTDGVATRTRALVIMRLPSEKSLPPVGDLTALFRQLRSNHSRLVLANAI